MLKEIQLPNKEITVAVRKAVLQAEKENALAISAIDLVENALRNEFNIAVKFGDEQTFRVIPTADATNQYNTLDENKARSDFTNPPSGSGLPGGPENRVRPIIVKLHSDNERQKYEVATNVGSAKQVARWIIMFRELAKLKAADYPGVEDVSFRGSHLIQFKGELDGKPREFMNTNGFHTNFSVLFDKKNLLEDRDFLMHAVHGVKTLSEESTLLTAMHADDYERYKIGKSHKANYVGVTEKKGDLSLRVVNVGMRETGKKRVEDRMASSSVNPYYAHLKILLGIYIGFKDKVKMAENAKKPILEATHADYGYLSNGSAAQDNSNLMEVLLSYFTKPKARTTSDSGQLHPIPKDIESAITEFSSGSLLRNSLNELNAKYGDNSPIGDKLHEQVLERVKEAMKESPSRQMQ